MTATAAEAATGIGAGEIPDDMRERLRMLGFYTVVFARCKFNGRPLDLTLLNRCDGAYAEVYSQLPNYSGVHSADTYGHTDPTIAGQLGSDLDEVAQFHPGKDMVIVF